MPHPSLLTFPSNLMAEEWCCMLLPQACSEVEGLAGVLYSSQQPDPVCLLLQSEAVAMTNVIIFFFFFQQQTC